MSSNKMATKSDLQEMYSRILPYLGGMPEMVANKFSKGDLYSTDEKMIGQWTDGKPLYQKTVNISNLQKLQAVSLGVTADTLVDSWVRLENSSYQFTNAVSYYVSGSDYRLFAINKNKSTNDVYYYIACSSDNLITGFTGHITIQYTKTTDSPISIGSDTDYSTGEKIVGTWIDGKPVYQKTVLFGNLPNSSSKKVPIGVNNLDKIVDFSAIAIDENNATFILPSSTCTDMRYAIECVILLPSNEIQIVTAVDRSTAIGYITVQYTKTTD